MVKKVFITGIAGLLGSTLAKTLLASGNYEVSGIDNNIGGILENVPKNAEFHLGDILDIELMKKLMKNTDTVFHAAALPYEGLSVFSPTITATSIVSGTISTAVAALHNKTRLFINCSSMARYGDSQTPFTEDLNTAPVDPYGLAKVTAEKYLKMLSDLHGLNYLTVVPHNVIGVGQRYYDPFRNVVGIMINRILQNKSIIVYGDGQQTRSFSDVQDCINVIEKLITSDKKLTGEVYNIGPDNNEMSIKDLAYLIGLIADKKVILEHFPDRPTEVKNAFCSSDKVRRDFSYSASIPMKQTISEMVDWIRPRVKEFEYHLPVELITDKTPKTWTDKLI